MEYKFKLVDWDGTKIYSIDAENVVLKNIGSWGWTPDKVQEIMDGVEVSKTLPKEEPYEWANEDVELNANENGVWLYDWLAHRAGQKDTEKLNLFITHSEMITFLSDFKKFVEENQE